MLQLSNVLSFPSFSPSLLLSQRAPSIARSLVTPFLPLSKYSRWALFISLGLAAYIYSLDGTTTYSYLSWAVSEFGKHSMISTIQVAQGIIGGCRRSFPLSEIFPCSVLPSPLLSLPFVVVYSR